VRWNVSILESRELSEPLIKLIFMINLKECQTRIMIILSVKGGEMEPGGREANPPRGNIKHQNPNSKRQNLQSPFFFGI